MPLSLTGRPEREQALSVLREAVRLGVHVVDTADAYGLGDEDFNHNEGLISEALGGSESRAQMPLIATKGGLRRPGGQWVVDSTPERLQWAVERSRLALRLKTLPIYFLHAPPQSKEVFAQSLITLQKFRELGWIRFVGLSNVTLEQYEWAKTFGPIHFIQNEFSFFSPQDRRSGLLQKLEEDRVVYFAYSPVGGWSQHTGRQKELGELQDLADQLQLSSYQALLLWALAQSPQVVVIPGSSRLESLRANQDLRKTPISTELATQLSTMYI